MSKSRKFSTYINAESVKSLNRMAKDDSSMMVLFPDCHRAKSVACIVNTRCTVNLLTKALHVLAVDSNDTRKE